MRLLPSLALAALLGSSLSAFADTITYTFTGSGYLAGTSITYVDTNGFASFSTAPLPPTGPSLIEFQGMSYGPANAINFIADDLAFGSNTLAGGIPNAPYSLTFIGTQTLTDSQNSHYSGSLTITDTPTVAATPEPSSLILLSTGALSVIGAIRRRPLGA